MSKRKNKKANHPGNKSATSSSTESAQAKLAAKKETVLGGKKNNRLPMFAAFACTILIAGGVFFYNQITNKNSAVATQYSASNAASSDSSSSVATQVSFPVSMFEDGKARHFEYRGSGVTIKYFIIKSSDGVIRAAFDACDVCWRAGKGYYQSGDYMVCRNCGRQFASVLVNEVQGGCNPAPLSRDIEGENLVIRIDNILAGKTYFNFI